MSLPMPWMDRIAHDLRGPLSPVQMAIDLLRSGRLDAARERELLDMIDRQARLLGRMIDEIGDWARIAQGTLLSSRAPCSPELLLDHALGSGSRRVEAPMRVEDRSGGVVVHGDEWRLTQLFRILADYARARGSDPAFSMSVEGDCLQVVVCTTMDEPVRPTLLTEPAPEPYDGGLGLNLLIARAIAEAHAGSLSADQTDDGVLRLRCSLPLGTA